MRLLLSWLIAVAITANAQQTSVLFIGNSYTSVNDLPNTLRLLALSLGDTVTVASEAPGGFTLWQHASSASTAAAINSQPWDFVVMQEQSQLGALPVDITTTETGAIALMEDIEANWECTYPVFYMTWGRQNGDADNCDNFPFMCTYDGMQQALRNNYVALAEWNDAWTAPVGVAWKQVRDTHPLINLYDADGSHPSPAGTYLAACVFYCTFFQESCVSATFNGSIDATTAATLRGIASSVVLGDITEWNLDVPNGTSALLDGATVGPDWITLVHNGQGTHLWTCTNGQSFTTGTVTFNFSTSDTYLVTHTYNDPCGNTDTVTLTFNIVVGVEEQAAGSPYQVWSASQGTMDVSGKQGGETLEVFDMQGRIVFQGILGSDRTQVGVGAGMRMWSVTDASGVRTTGRLMVP